MERQLSDLSVTSLSSTDASLQSASRPHPPPDSRLEGGRGSYRDSEASMQTHECKSCECLHVHVYIPAFMSIGNVGKLMHLNINSQTYSFSLISISL